MLSQDIQGLENRIGVLENQKQGFVDGRHEVYKAILSEIVKKSGYKVGDVVNCHRTEKFRNKDRLVPVCGPIIAFYLRNEPFILENLRVGVQWATNRSVTVHIKEIAHAGKVAV